MRGNPLIEVKDMCKNFGVTVALNHVSFTVYAGEVVGLIGENGSGKSTVSSIIAGMQPATSGEMTYQGQPWKPASTLQAQEAGIAMIVQETGTIPNITVAENIFLGHEKMFAKGPFISRPAMTRAAQELLDRLEIPLDASARTASLDLASRKLVEIAKALYWKPKILVVDETTTALSQAGRMLLYRYMREVADAGGAVMFISHELDEMMVQCDSLTVLRDGVIAGTLMKAEYDPDIIKQLMVGRKVEGNYYRADMDGYGEEVVLKADCITTMKDLLCFSLELHKGEILGIGGLSHCGMHTLGRALFGAEEVLDGQVLAGTGQKPIRSPKQAIACRMAYVSKDRDTDSLSLSASIHDNIASTGYWKNLFANLFVDFKKENQYVNQQVDQLSIKCATTHHAVDTLSGGNKQKVAMGKWLAADSEILIMDCPTRGIDIGVKASMYELIYQMKKAGKSILLISEELPELIGMSDRVIIMRDGEIACERMRSEHPTEGELVNYMF